MLIWAKWISQLSVHLLFRTILVDWDPVPWCSQGTACPEPLYLSFIAIQRPAADLLRERHPARTQARIQCPHEQAIAAGRSSAAATRSVSPAQPLRRDHPVRCDGENRAAKLRHHFDSLHHAAVMKLGADTALSVPYEALCVLRRLLLTTPSSAHLIADWCGGSPNL
jgi:hypothetical protein